MAKDFVINPKVDCQKSETYINISSLLLFYYCFVRCETQFLRNNLLVSMQKLVYLHYPVRDYSVHEAPNCFRGIMSVFIHFYSDHFHFKFHGHGFIFECDIP